MGAATGWRLAARGAQVVCFDRHSPPHAFGSSHGESRITRTAYFEGPWYVPLLKETFPLWRELEAASGAELLTLTGALMIGPPDAEAVTGALAAAAGHGLDVRLFKADELRRAYPGHKVGNRDVAVLDTQAGFIRPEAAVAAMIGRVEALGGEIRRGVLVSAVNHQCAGGVEVVTDGERETFDAVVIAAGPWMHELIDWLPLTVERQVLAWFALDQNADWLTPRRFPVFIRQADDIGDVYGFPTLDGVTVISACSGHGFKFAPVIGDIAADLVCDGRTARDISHFSLERFHPTNSEAAPKVRGDPL